MPAAKQSNDFFKNFSSYSAPSVDFNELFNVCRRNLEVCSAANQVIAEGAQAISKRYVEALQSSMEKCLSASRDIIGSASAEAGTQKHSEASKEVFENCVNSVREISEMASKSAFEAFDMVNKRYAEAMEETTKLAKKAA